MLRPFPLLLSMLMLVSTAVSAEQRFECGGAQVTIEVVASDGRQIDAVVTAEREGRTTVLRYRYVDFIGGACVPMKEGAPSIAFQAFCDGTACADLANWGVIESDTLRVLTVPSDTNMAETRRLLGQALPQFAKMSVEAEARHLGIPIPP